MKQDRSCGCIIVKQDKVLLIGARDDDGTMYWGFPKGHQEEGETFVETALRETKEETGLDVEIIDNEPVVAEYLIRNNTTLKHVYLFFAKPISKKIVLQEEEAEKAEWVPVKKVAKRLSSHFTNVWQEALKKPVIAEAFKKQKVEARRTAALAILFVLATIITAGALNRDLIYDYYRSVSYQPSEEMKEIRKDLGLTEYGTFLFNAVQPELDEAEEFNQICRQNDDEIAVLGCYTMGTVFVYNIDEESLAGIKELTTAHELLHAVWARMGESEQQEFASVLVRVFNENKNILEEEITIYDPDRQREEIFVRAGTEIKELPEVLENKYAEVFKDQDKIVDFYNSYISVFNDARDKINVLEKLMNDLNTEIGTKMVQYGNWNETLNNKIVDFNDCAMIEGCFKDEVDFYTKRDQLIAEQERLDDFNEEINGLIKEYNSMVNEYNDSVIESKKLQDLVNSNSETKKIN